MAVLLYLPLQPVADETTLTTTATAHRATLLVAAIRSTITILATATTTTTALLAAAAVAAGAEVAAVAVVASAVVVAMAEAAVVAADVAKRHTLTHLLSPPFFSSLSVKPANNNFTYNEKNNPFGISCC
jgi:hypothetical protein